MIITEVEHRALSRILSALEIRDPHLGPILKSLNVDQREWSEDVTDAGKCFGQFIYFSPSEKLPLDFSVTHQGMWASHPEAVCGVDFLLFIKSGVPLFLEIGFFGTPVPKVILAGSLASFDFRT